LKCGQRWIALIEGNRPADPVEVAKPAKPAPKRMPRTVEIETKVVTPSDDQDTHDLDQDREDSQYKHCPPSEEEERETYVFDLRKELEKQVNFYTETYNKTRAQVIEYIKQALKNVEPAPAPAENIVPFGKVDEEEPVTQYLNRRSLRTRLG
jgi:hypothetical protein